jgi:hypothetical protein
MKSDLEYRLVWVFSIISTLSGVALAVWMKQSQSSVPILLLGLAHAVVFIPAMLIAQANLWRIIGLSIICITFPIWGYGFVSLLAQGIGSPLANSLIWGVVVTFGLKQTRAIYIFLGIGLVTTIVLYYFMFVSDLNSMANIEGGFAETIGLWYLLVLPVFPILFRYADRAPPKGQCAFCGYSLEGLPEDAPCPECGRENSGFCKEV